MRRYESRYGPTVREWLTPDAGFTARQMVRDALTEAALAISTTRLAFIERMEAKGYDQDEAVAAVDEAIDSITTGVRSPLTRQAEDWLLKEDPEVIYETFLKVLSGGAMNDLVQTVYDNRGEAL